MRQIFKYDISKPIVGRIEEFLHLDYQNGEPMVWAIVDDDAPEQNYSVICSGTGWPIADFQSVYNYLGTLQDDAGYVWHYFVLPTEKRKGHSLNVELKFSTDDKKEKDEFVADMEEFPMYSRKAFMEKYAEYIMKQLKPCE